MKILLVSPIRDQNSYTNKGILIPQLALFIIHGLTPDHHHVKIVEEEYVKLDLNEKYDVVGISCMTSNSNRSYRIADVFRKNGAIVIMGGVHPSILPNEALTHSDAVVIGEAEGVWEKILDDIESNSLKRIYHEPNPDLDRYIPKDFSMLPRKRFYNLIPIQTTRGCPYNCDFCCVSNLFGKKIKEIPLKHIVRDIKESGSKNFIFLDDNIIGNRKYARELFKALIPLRIKWAGQSSISFSRDEEMMKLAKKSGCRALFVGLESVLETNNQRFKKLTNIEDTQSSIKKIQNMGILIHASLIFGFDEDTLETFGQTLRFLIKNRIGNAAINVLTPYPGTQVFNDLKEQGRLLHETWEYYDHHTVVFQPKNMTALELQMGKIRIRTTFWRISSIGKRLLGNLRMPVLYLLINLRYRRHMKRDRKTLRNFKSQLRSGKAREMEYGFVSNVNFN